MPAMLGRGGATEIEGETMFKRMIETLGEAVAGIVAVAIVVSMLMAGLVPLVKMAVLTSS